MHYTIILNPTAGHGAAGRRRKRLEAALVEADASFRLLVTEGPGHAAALAREAATPGEALVAVGGDGTVQEVARGLLESGQAVHLGVLPAGTGNDFVKMLGMPRWPRAAVTALLHAVPQPVDYGVVRWWDEAQRRGAGSGELDASSTDNRQPATGNRHVFVNAVGAGFDAQVAAAAGRFKRLPGLTGYLVAVFDTLRRWEAPRTRVHLDGQEAAFYDGALLLVTAANGVSSGGGFYLTPEASVTDGLLDVCLVEHATTGRILQIIPFALRGRHIGAPEVHMSRTKRVKITSDAPVFVHADGEILTKQAEVVDIEVVRGGLSVLVPPHAGNSRRRL